MLSFTVLGPLTWMPTNGGWIEDDLRAAECRQTCRFRKPLIPADERAYASVARLERAKAEIAGREVELFVIERIIGNVHLAIASNETPISINHDRCVVIHARCAPLKE